MSKELNQDVWLYGAGLFSSLGHSYQELGRRLAAGDSGIREQDQFDCTLFTNALCAPVVDFKANAYVANRKNLKLMSRSVRLGMGAIRVAMNDAAPRIRPVHPSRFGIVVGAGLALGQSRDLVPGIKASFDNGEFSGRRFGEVGMKAINPLWLLKGLSNNVLGFATAELDAQGFNQNYCNSGISGLQAIGEAFWALRENRADLIIAGGSDSALDPYHYTGFTQLKALSKADRPSAVRSFDQHRDGFVLGEGSAYFVLGRADVALPNAKPLARILGASTLTCAEDPIGGRPEMIAALISKCCSQANRNPDEIGGIIAHGNGSRRFDQVEAEGIRSVFGDRCPPVTTNKPQLGHAIAASGPLSVGSALYAGQQRLIPPISNLDNIAAECGGINLVMGSPHPMSTSTILVLSAGLGGQIAALILEVIS